MHLHISPDFTYNYNIIKKEVLININTRIHLYDNVSAKILKLLNVNTYIKTTMMVIVYYKCSILFDTYFYRLMEKID